MCKWSSKDVHMLCWFSSGYLGSRTVPGFPNVLEVPSASRWNYVNGLFLLMLALVIYEPCLSKTMYVRVQGVK